MSSDVEKWYAVPSWYTNSRQILSIFFGTKWKAVPVRCKHTYTQTHSSICYAVASSNYIDGTFSSEVGENICHWLQEDTETLHPYYAYTVNARSQRRLFSQGKWPEGQPAESHVTAPLHTTATTHTAPQYYVTLGVRVTAAGGLLPYYDAQVRHSALTWVVLEFMLLRFLLTYTFETGKTHPDAKGRIQPSKALKSQWKLS